MLLGKVSISGKDFAMDDKDTKNTPASKNKYGKRPIWQWVLLYIVVAIVVYGLVYYFFMNKNDSSDNGKDSGGSGLYNY
jgi:flagellar basal body-associated protein FliL